MYYTPVKTSILPALHSNLINHKNWRKQKCFLTCSKVETCLCVFHQAVISYSMLGRNLENNSGIWKPCLIHCTCIAVLKKQSFPPPIEPFHSLCRREYYTFHGQSFSIQWCVSSLFLNVPPSVHRNLQDHDNTLHVTKDRASSGAEQSSCLGSQSKPTSLVRAVTISI